MAFGIRTETPVHTETAAVNQERAAKPRSMRTGAAVCAVQSRAQHRLGWEGRTDAVCSWKKRNEKTAPHGY